MVSHDDIVTVAIVMGSVSSVASTITGILTYRTHRAVKGLDQKVNGNVGNPG